MAAKKSAYSQLYRKALSIGIGFAVVLIIGTAGYSVISAGKYTLLDCLYMTFITIATIGYGEIVDLSGSPGGRVFTMFISVAGIGIATYGLTSITAFIVEGELRDTFRRRKMDKIIRDLKGHYIVCGIGHVGFHVIHELYQTKRPHVVIDTDRKSLERVLEGIPGTLFIEGDATDTDTLSEANVIEARGLFATTGDDNQNLVIGFTAKQIKPDIRVVASCRDIKNIDKMKKAGADAVVSPTYIGGLRMASEMVRSTVVSFLDTMLRDREKNLRIEEVTIPESFAGRPISDLSLAAHPHTLLLAIRSGKGWTYYPPRDHEMLTGEILIFMTTPEERIGLEKLFSRT